MSTVNTPELKLELTQTLTTVSISTTIQFDDLELELRKHGLIYKVAATLLDVDDAEYAAYQAGHGGIDWYHFFPYFMSHVFAPRFLPTGNEAKQKEAVTFRETFPRGTLNWDAASPEELQASVVLGIHNIKVSPTVQKSEVHVREMGG